MSESPKERWMAAIAGGDVEVVRDLFEQHPSLSELVNEPIFPFDSSAVFQCRENVEMVDLLVEHGADLNLKTRWWAGGFGLLEGVDKDTAQPLIERGAVVDIWAAVGLNDADRVVSLLDDDPDLILARGGDGKHPLHYAQTAEMVDLLVARGADPSARDIDHESTPAHYQVDNEPAVRRLLHHGAVPDIFLAAALGDVAMAKRCIESDPDCTEARLGVGEWANDAGGHIYNWTLGHDYTPQDVAHERAHAQVLRLLLDSSSPQRRLAHALWHGEAERVQELLDLYPVAVPQLIESDPALVARAAWWYRPKTVSMLLELGFDPHVTAVHDSTPLDRAAFHGYADIIATLLEADPDPPVDFRNEFGGTPLGACVHGAVHGWQTGHPQNHALSARLLIEAGCSFSSTWLPTGSQEMDQLLQEYLSE